MPVLPCSVRMHSTGGIIILPEGFNQGTYKSLGLSIVFQYDLFMFFEYD